MVLGVLLVFVIFKSGLLGYVYDIRVASEGVQFLLLSSFVVSVTKYESIEEVVETSWGGFHYLMAYNFKNRAGGRCFLIRKKHGWFARAVLVTPRDPAVFLEGLKNAGVRVVKEKAARASPNQPVDGEH
jgi:hypothetical protein